MMEDRRSHPNDGHEMKRARYDNQHLNNVNSDFHPGGNYDPGPSSTSNLPRPPTLQYGAQHQWSPNNIYQAPGMIPSNCYGMPQSTDWFQRQNPASYNGQMVASMPGVGYMGALTNAQRGPSRKRRRGGSRGRRGQGRGGKSTDNPANYRFSSPLHLGHSSIANPLHLHCIDNDTCSFNGGDGDYDEVSSQGTMSSSSQELVNGSSSNSTSASDISQTTPRIGHPPSTGPEDHNLDFVGARPELLSVHNQATVATRLIRPALQTPKNMNELICNYIDYLLEENEHITKISKSFTPPTPLLFEDEKYVQEVQNSDVRFPTPGFTWWMKQAYPDLNIQLQITTNKAFGQTAEQVVSDLNTNHNNNVDKNNNTGSTNKECLEIGRMEKNEINVPANAKCDNQTSIDLPTQNQTEGKSHEASTGEHEVILVDSSTDISVKNTHMADPKDGMLDVVSIEKDCQEISNEKQQIGGEIGRCESNQVTTGTQTDLNDIAEHSGNEVKKVRAYNGVGEDGVSINETSAREGFVDRSTSTDADSNAPQVTQKTMNQPQRSYNDRDQSSSGKQLGDVLTGPAFPQSYNQYCGMVKVIPVTNQSAAQFLAHPNNSITSHGKGFQGKPLYWNPQVRQTVMSSGLGYSSFQPRSVGPMLMRSGHCQPASYGARPVEASYAVQQSVIPRYVDQSNNYKNHGYVPNHSSQTTWSGNYGNHATNFSSGNYGQQMMSSGNANSQCQNNEPEQLHYQQL